MSNELGADVVIAGAGPNGLMVARELALAGVRPVIIEQMSGPGDEPKANGLVGEVIRALDMRGLYHEFGGSPGAPQPIPRFTFSGIPVSFAGMTDNPMFALLIPQPRLVRLLLRSTLDRGVEIRWGHELLDLTQTADRVTLTVAGPGGVYDLTTRYLVGADGGRSRVRKTIGIDFPGTTSDMIARLAHVRVPDSVRTGDGGLDIPGYGRLSFGHNRLEHGGLVYADFEPGRQMLGTMEFGGPVADDVPMSMAEMRDSARRVLGGVELPFEPPAGSATPALRRINGQNTRQADRYRDGNVFLVGDAAHVHSAMGGPGLNLGLQDAVNLGWKLAAQVNGWAPTGLLDTYQSERYPLGERVMIHSMSQTALMAPGPEVTAMRTLFGELMQKPDNAEHLARLLAGADIRYDMGDGPSSGESHESGEGLALAGRFVPELTLASGARLADLMHDGRAVLLDRSGGAFAATVLAAPAAVAARVNVLVDDGVDSLDAPVGVLIRPDGYVAWAGREAGDDEMAGLKAAMTRWLGA